MLYNRAKLERDLAAVDRLDMERSGAIANGYISGLAAKNEVFTMERAGGKLLSLTWDDMLDRKRRELRMRLMRVGQLLGELDFLNHSSRKDAGQLISDVKAKLRFLRVCPSCDGFPRTISQNCSLCGAELTNPVDIEGSLRAAEEAVVPEAAPRLCTIAEAKEAARRGLKVQMRPRIAPTMALIWEAL